MEVYNVKFKISVFFSVLFCFVILFFMVSCSAKDNKNTEELERKSSSSEISYTDDRNPEEKDIYNEQISCNDQNCVRIDYRDYTELDEKIGDLMSQNAGKIFIQMRHYSHRLNADELEGVRPYFREISAREGRVSLEPYYMGYRVLEKIPFSFVKDSALVGWDIFSRIRDSIKYRFTKNYNAKVLYHPKYHTIMMIFFLHRSYGDVCRTVYSDCMELEYLDDETFDIALSNALEKANKEKRTVRVNFRQEQANLFELKLDLDNLKQLDKSARLYKWLVLAEKTEQKPIKKDRFIGASVIISLIDYSVKLYDFLKQYKIYSPVFKTRAEVLYSGQERGGKIESVTFLPLE